MTKRTLFKRFRRDQKGATAVEFAMISMVFFMMMMGMIEYGLYMMTQVAVESAVTQASRVGAITPGTAPDRATAVRNFIIARTAGLPRASSITTSATVVSGSTGGTRTPDICVDSNNNPTTPDVCPSGSTYIEMNGIPNYQGPGGITVGVGGDLVEIRVNYPWRVYFPVFNQFFTSTDSQGNQVRGVVLISAMTVVRNEPF